MVRCCWRLLTFLLSASGSDIQNKSPPLEGMSLACDPWKWVVLMQHQEDESAFPALTVKSHKAKEVWCILRVNVDPMQGRGWRGKRSSSMVPISITVTECEWVLHRQKYLASEYCFEFHKPSSLMDNPLDRRTSYTLESSSAFAASPGSLMS